GGIERAGILMVNVVHHPKMADFTGPATGAAIDPAVNHQRAADARTDGDIEDGRKAVTGAKERLRQAGGVRIVAEKRGNAEVLFGPAGQRKTTPAETLMRAQPAALLTVPRPAEAEGHPSQIGSRHIGGIQ